MKSLSIFVSFLAASIFAVPFTGHGHATDQGFEDPPGIALHTSDEIFQSFHGREGKSNNTFDRELGFVSDFDGDFYYDDFDEDLDSEDNYDGDVDMDDEDEDGIVDESGIRNLQVTMTTRDQKWLASHNSRRKKYHIKYNTSFVPLKWSRKLKRRSKVWAEKLAQQCGKGIYHDPKNPFGENIATNWGTGTWARRPPPNSVLTRFVENEENKKPPYNYHFTQVLWRSSLYVGCAEASKKLSNGRCHVQVCRYARPGNCNMRSYKDFKAPMLMENSPCKPFCPPEGCF